MKYVYGSPLIALGIIWAFYAKEWGYDDGMRDLIAFAAIFAGVAIFGVFKYREESRAQVEEENSDIPSV